MTYHFATLFDQNYLTRGLCLIQSLDQVLNNGYSLYILALDSYVEEYFKANHRQNITVLNLQQLEECYPELSIAKNNRSKVEYYFTLSPILPLYILKKIEDCDRITTLDSDIYFFSTPAEIFNSYGSEDILITPHDFPPTLESLAKFGKYNVSFQSFPNTKNSLSVLEDWKEKCLNWCYDYQDEKTGNYADQKYLDNWSTNFSYIKSITLKTCGRAPWNISNTDISFPNQSFLVEGKPLIYYHFHSLRINNRCVSHGLQGYDINGISKALKKVYSTYTLALYNFNKKINLFNDNTVARINVNSKNSFPIFWFIFLNEIGAIVLSSKRVFFFNLKIKTYFVQLRNFLKWQP